MATRTCCTSTRAAASTVVLACQSVPSMQFTPKARCPLTKMHGSVSTPSARRVCQWYESRRIHPRVLTRLRSVAGNEGALEPRADPLAHQRIHAADYVAAHVSADFVPVAKSALEAL